MINSSLEFKVQYSDTDAYKVVWHGSYLRWMEAGRVDFLYLNGVDIKALEDDFGIVMPVVEINIKYKQSAKLLEDVIVKTSVVEISNTSVVFEQVVSNKTTGQVYVIANVKGAAIKDGKICRNLKEILKEE